MANIPQSKGSTRLGSTLAVSALVLAAHVSLTAPALAQDNECPPEDARVTNEDCVAESPSPTPAVVTEQSAPEPTPPPSAMPTPTKFGPTAGEPWLPAAAALLIVTSLAVSADRRLQKR